MPAEGREKSIDSGQFSGLACSGRLPCSYSKAGLWEHCQPLLTDSWEDYKDYKQCYNFF